MIVVATTNGAIGLDTALTVLRAGAVAALQSFPHPISVARALLEELPEHSLLAGAGAARLAPWSGACSMV